MRWVAACVIGEGIGIAIVSLGYALGDRAFPEMAALLILLAGTCEGLSLGTAQALAGRRAGIRMAPWITATVAAAVIGYGLSLVAQLSGENAPATATASEPPLLLIITGGAGLGLFMGMFFGGAQAFVLPAGVSKRGWIFRNALGWTPAMAVIMAAASMAGRDWPFASVSLLGLGAGAVAGAFIGLATKGALEAASR